MLGREWCSRSYLCQRPQICGSSYLNRCDESAQQVVTGAGLRRRDGQACAVLNVPHIGEERPRLSAAERGLGSKPRNDRRERCEQRRRAAKVLSVRWDDRMQCAGVGVRGILGRNYEADT